jgi:hypothetical protein
MAFKVMKVNATTIEHIELGIVALFISHQLSRRTPLAFEKS